MLPVCEAYANPLHYMALECGPMEIYCAMKLYHVHGHGACNLSDRVFSVYDNISV